RTGSEAVYDPGGEERIGERVDALLADGLTIEEAVQVALLNNRSLQAAFQELGVSRAQVVQSGLMNNPSLSLVFKLPEGGGRPNAEFNLAQELATLWQIPLRKEAAKAQLEAVVLEVAARAVNLAADVRVRGYELLALEEGAGALQESLQLLERSQALAQRQFEAGTVSRLDVNLARSNVMEIQIEMIGLERQRQLAEAALARLMNLSARLGSWRLADRLPEPRGVPGPELLAWALGQRLDARQAEYAVRRAEWDLRQECLRVFPSVQMGLSLEVLERRAQAARKVLADAMRESIANGAPTVPSIESRGQRALNRRQIIDAMLGPSLAFTLPIWDQNQAHIAAAVYRVIQRRKDYENLLDQVANEVNRALRVVENAASLVRFYRDEALPQAQLSVDGARSLYEAGQQGIIVLIEAQGSYILRRRAYVRALGDHAVAMAELERAVGGRLPAPPASQPVGQAGP
ncbi:MAG: TolC family protein, partial [Phycisphaerae bacterium]